MKQTMCSVWAVWVALGCSSVDSTAVEVPDVPLAQLVDTVQWNGETISFYDATSEEGGPDVAVSLLGPDDGHELLTTLERQLGRSPTPAELWLAAGGDLAGVPDELLAAHEAQALEEGRPAVLEKWEVDADLVEKAVSQRVFNGMFPLTQSETGVPTSQRACWTALAREVTITQTGFGQRVCSGNANNVANWLGGSFNCDAAFNVNGTLRTGMHVTVGPGVTGLHCFGTGNGVFTCQSPTTVPANFFFALSFIKNGSKHRVGTGAITGGNSSNSIVTLGSADLILGILPAFGNTTCELH